MVKAPDETCGWWKLQIKGLGVIKFRPSNETRLTQEVGGGWQDRRDPGCAQSDPGGGPAGGCAPPPPTPNPPTSPSRAWESISGSPTESPAPTGAVYPGVTEDRTQIKARRRELSAHDHRHRKAGTDRYTPGRRRKVKAVGKAYARTAERERHSVHRLVHHIISFCVASGVDGVAVELLQIKNLIRNSALSDSISQQRWGMFLRLLELKAARAGLAYAQVNPRNTSLDCSRCKHRKPKKDLPLEVRVYECGRCGLRLDRDVNAADQCAGAGLRRRSPLGVGQPPDLASTPPPVGDLRRHRSSRVERQ